MNQALKQDATVEEWSLLELDLEMFIQLFEIKESG
jgi:hypothetical protein